MRFPFFRQLDAMDCGPACLRMVAKYYDKTVSTEQLRCISNLQKDGASILGLAEAAERIGLSSMGAKLSFDQLINDAPLPAIIYWDQYHFVVLTPASRKNRLVVADPSAGVLRFSKEEFLSHWITHREEDGDMGISLLLEKSPRFKRKLPLSDVDKSRMNLGRRFLLTALIRQRFYLFQVILGLAMGCLLQLGFPYLTQAIVDKGIRFHDLSFVTVVLIGQLFLLLSQTVIDLLRSRLLLFFSTNLNVSLISAFWAKLLRLPIQFYQTRNSGDIIQRLGDHHRIENFLTGSALSTVFSLLNLIVFSVVLLNYNMVVFAIFCASGALYYGWLQLFLRKRKKLDYARFHLGARENNATMQLVHGIQEIKLNNAEDTYKRAWEQLQTGLFELNFKSLSITQYQEIGAFFIAQGKNLVITFIVARMVIQGELTLGMMLSIQYILGQMNYPLEQLIVFRQQAQDAVISVDRLNDVHGMEDEEPEDRLFVRDLPAQKDIRLSNVSFSFHSAGHEPVISNIDLLIPAGKTTAIVGMSGSGKTTLLKLLLKFWQNYSGDITIGNQNFNDISPSYWRSICGVVMQDSFIFNDTIQNNITLSDENIDKHRLLEACRTANILAFVETLPLGFHTKIGSEGIGLSGGEKQRLAIARAVYKDPTFIFFDEATNSLDANNEMAILANLQGFFRNKTAIVVAHRLSTVKNADNIIVMDKGRIVEQGTHEELCARIGNYYQLVKNQLELGT